jgi:hypothetical protein
LPNKQNKFFRKNTNGHFALSTIQDSPYTFPNASAIADAPLNRFGGTDYANTETKNQHKKHHTVILHIVCQHRNFVYCRTASTYGYYHFSL